jgi:hypothetical protein
MAFTATIVAALSAGALTEAIASGPSTVTACVHHHGGVLYEASQCARRDVRLVLSIAGPPGKQVPRVRSARQEPRVRLGPPDRKELPASQRRHRPEAMTHLRSKARCRPARGL